MSRINPFNNLDEFTPKPEAKPVEKAQIDKIAADNGFPSRQAMRMQAEAAAPSSPLRRARRHTTGRNQQLNIKATAETIARFYAVADREDMPLGELLEKALQTFEESTQKTVQGPL